MERLSTPDSREQLERWAMEAYQSTGFLIVHKTLIKQFGLITAVILSNLIEKNQYFKSRGKLINGYFFQTHEQQMETLGLTEYSVKKSKQELIKKKILKIKQMGMPAKEWFQIDYSELFKNIKNIVGQDPQDSGGQDPQDSGGLYNNTINKEYYMSDFDDFGKNKTPPNGHITPSQFEQFWQLYPKKNDKGKALTAWNKITSKKPKDRPTWKQIKTAILRQQKTDRWREKEFIPHPTTWLNQSRWLDDPDQMITYNKNDKPKYMIENGQKWHLRPDGQYRNNDGEILDV